MLGLLLTPMGWLVGRAPTQRCSPSMTAFEQDGTASSEAFSPILIRPLWIGPAESAVQPPEWARTVRLQDSETVFLTTTQRQLHASTRMLLELLAQGCDSLCHRCPPQRSHSRCTSLIPCPVLQQAASTCGVNDCARLRLRLGRAEPCRSGARPDELPRVWYRRHGGGDRMCSAKRRAERPGWAQQLLAAL